MKQLLRMMLAITFSLALSSAVYADTINGKIKEINTANNSLTLVHEFDETAAATEYKLVWDTNLVDFDRLRTARVGDFIIVDAEQNPMTRNWKVTTIRGPMSSVINAISSNQRAISGEIRSLDIKGRSLTLVSADSDVSGKTVEYRVVWDESNKDVHNRFVKAKIGDKISVMADQNKINQHWKANSFIGAFEGMVQVDVKTITGQIQSVDLAKNSLVLRTTDVTGKVVDRKIVWDKNFKEQAKFEKVRIGDQLSVRADQNMFTRDWNVKALGV